MLALSLALLGLHGGLVGEAVPADEAGDGAGLGLVGGGGPRHAHHHHRQQQAQEPRHGGRRCLNTSLDPAHRHLKIYIFVIVENFSFVHSCLLFSVHGENERLMYQGYLILDWSRCGPRFPLWWCSAEFDWNIFRGDAANGFLSSDTQHKSICWNVFMFSRLKGNISSFHFLSTVKCFHNIKYILIIALMMKTPSKFHIKGRIVGITAKACKLLRELT